MYVRFRVVGIPISQGSMTPVRNRQTGKMYARHNNAYLVRWREQIAREARMEGVKANWFRMVDTPSITIDMVFGLPRPTKHFRGTSVNVKDEYKAVLPSSSDLDKLTRAVLDALTGVLYTDDKYVVELRAKKVYASFTVIDVYTTANEKAKPLGQTQSATLEHDKADSAGTGQLPLFPVWGDGSE